MVQANVALTEKVKEILQDEDTKQWILTLGSESSQTNCIHNDKVILGFGIGCNTKQVRWLDGSGSSSLHLIKVQF